MQKPGKFIGITLLMGVILSMYLMKKVFDSIFSAVVIIGIALAIGVFLEYRMFRSKRK